MRTEPKYDFAPGDNRALMMEPGTRVIVFEEESGVIAMAVDAVHCTFGDTIEKAAEDWEIIAEAYKNILEKEGPWCEPPKPFEYEKAWETGEAVFFLDGIDARKIDRSTFLKYDRPFHRRLEALGWGCPEEKKASNPYAYFELDGALYRKRIMNNLEVEIYDGNGVWKEYSDPAKITSYGLVVSKEDADKLMQEIG